MRTKMKIELSVKIFKYKKYFEKNLKIKSEDFNSLLHFNGSCTDVILLKDMSSID